MSETLHVVTWVWRGERDYSVEHAWKLYRTVRRHATFPVLFTAIVDPFERRLGAADFFTLATPPAARALANLKTPERSNFPSSYRRLWLFSEEAARVFPGRVMLVDVDAVATADWAPLFGGARGHAEPGSGGQRLADFVAWRPRLRWGGEDRVAGGQWLLRTGTRTDVYDDFVRDPARAIETAKRAGFRGSDQAWLSYKLARDPRTAFWRQGDGLYSVRDFLARDARGRRVPERPGAPVDRRLPPDARVVHFNGHEKPWHPSARERFPWLKEHWPA